MHVLDFGNVQNVLLELFVNTHKSQSLGK